MYCTMMKNFKMPGALSRGRKPEGDLGAKDVASVLGEVKIMTIFC
jgi:hypothetical protein